MLPNVFHRVTNCFTISSLKLSIRLRTMKLIWFKIKNFFWFFKDWALSKSKWLPFHLTSASITTFWRKRKWSGWKIIPLRGCPSQGKPAFAAPTFRLWTKAPGSFTRQFSVGSAMESSTLKTVSPSKITSSLGWPKSLREPRVSVWPRETGLYLIRPLTTVSEDCAKGTWTHTVVWKSSTRRQIVVSLKIPPMYYSRFFFDI